MEGQQEILQVTQRQAVVVEQVPQELPDHLRVVLGAMEIFLI
jgi:hypothetical protein